MSSSYSTFFWLSLHCFECICVLNEKEYENSPVSLEIVKLYTGRQLNSNGRNRTHLTLVSPVSKFYEFKSRLNFSKNRFELSTGLNLDKLNAILSETNHI